MNTAILFDLDGTLLDTLEDLADATNYSLRHFGFPERSLEEIRRFVGNGARNQIRLSLPEGSSEETICAVLAFYKDYYNTHCQIKTCPYDGITNMLQALRGDYPLAIVSNKPDPTVKRLCAEYFPGIYAMGESPACPRKPAPDMICHVMDALGVQRCIYVGDSEVDVLTAKNADVPCLSVTWGFRTESDLTAAGASWLCHTPAELPRILKDMMG